MAVSFDDHSTFEMLTQFVIDNSLSDIVSNSSVVDVVLKKEPDRESDTYFALLEALVDMFHDHYSLDSKNRRFVSKALMDRRLDLTQLKTLFDAGRAPTASAPPLTQTHIAQTHSGPYPVKSNAGPPSDRPEVMEGDSPRTQLQKNWLDTYRAKEEAAAASGPYPATIGEHVNQLTVAMDPRSEAPTAPPSEVASAIDDVAVLPTSEGPLTTVVKSLTVEGPHLRGSLEQDHAARQWARALLLNPLSRHPNEMQ